MRDPGQPTHDWKEDGLAEGSASVRLVCTVCGSSISYSGERVPRGLVDYIPISGPYKGMRCHEVAVARVLNT